MDANTKKLIEKYKQELLAAAAKPRNETPQTQRSDGSAMSETVETSPEKRSVGSPRVIAWSADRTAAEELEKYFTDIPDSDDILPEEEPDSVPDSFVYTPDEDNEEPVPVTEAPVGRPDDFTTLPPQFTEEAPQYNFTNENVSPENNSVTDANEQESEPQFRREGENTASNPEQAESLGTVPESGQSPEEQLGRRSFESRNTPVNSPEDIKPLVQEGNEDYPNVPREPEYSDLDDFLKANPRQGSVRFRTYTARNALPVEGARVILSKMIGGSRHTFYDIITDSSGLTPVLELPAPSASLSQTPVVTVQPYSLYDAEITAKGFIPVSIRSLPVFEGIISIQRAALVPSAGTNEREEITESEPDLSEVPNA